MSSTRRSVAFIGLHSDAPFPESFVQKYGTADELQAKLDSEIARANKAGFDIVLHHIDLDKATKDLAKLEEELKRGKYQGVMIGAGVRTISEHTVLFETLVNMCRRFAPDIPLMFNSEPGTNCEALERGYGIPM
ncbi:hypothetical protein PG988_016070 [Apiospora saccharicola]